MKITSRGRYALRASLALARLSHNGEPVPISTLSFEEHISSVFLEQIFFKLRKYGLVYSVRGPGGGFCLAKPATQINAKEILVASGEILDFKDEDDADTGNTAGSKRCREAWAHVTDLVNDYFSGMTLAAMLENDNG